MAGPVKLFLLALCVAASVTTAPAAERQYTDEFIRGYAVAVVNSEFDVTAASLNVRDGVVTLACRDINQDRADRLRRRLAIIPGVTGVYIVTEREFLDAIEQLTGKRFLVVEEREEQGEWDLFPARTLFRPLLADPRWPHISLTHYNANHHEFHEMGVISAGYDLPLVRYSHRSGRSIEVGVQGSAFALFNLDVRSTILVNTDPTVGIPVSYRDNRFSVLWRLSHQSTHLGDEYILEHGTNVHEYVSVEMWDLTLSYETPESWRIFLGVAEPFAGRPEDRLFVSTHVGFEYRSPKSLSLGIGTVRPVGAFYIQHRERDEWEASLTVRAGAEIESLSTDSLQVHLLGEFHDGYMPDGQFFRERTRYFGIGLHVFQN